MLATKLIKISQALIGFDLFYGMVGETEKYLRQHLSSKFFKIQNAFRMEKQKEYIPNFDI